jgi:hypothetical protein
LRIRSRLQTLHHIPSNEATTAGDEMCFAIHEANIVTGEWGLGTGY